MGQTDLPRRPDLNFPGAELDCRLLGCPLFVPAVPSGSGNTSLVLAYLSCGGNSKNLRVGGGPGDNAVGRSWGVKALLLKLNLQTKHTLSLLGFYVATFLKRQYFLKLVFSNLRKTEEVSIIGFKNGVTSLYLLLLLHTKLLQNLVASDNCKGLTFLAKLWSALSG